MTKGEGAGSSNKNEAREKGFGLTVLILLCAILNGFSRTWAAAGRGGVLLYLVTPPEGNQSFLISWLSLTTKVKHVLISGQEGIFYVQKNISILYT